jgi:class 3 adenylate cyclase
LLSPYHAQLRSELERFGGTVEKFIGDAVLALFGAPGAHEDDLERSVRAALAIRDWAAEQGRELQQAFEFYRSVSAAHYVREREALLAASA